jgi:hypothetical protein
VRPGGRAWIPAVVLTVVVIAGLLIWYASTRPVHAPVGSSSPAPTASPGLHTKEAVIQAVKDYYKVEDQARATGNADLIDSVTVNQDAPANLNFRQFIRVQTAKGKRSVIVADHFKDWDVALNGDKAVASFTFWVHGHDTDLSGTPLEPDQDSVQDRYRATLRLDARGWLMYERDLVKHAP